MSHMKHCCIRKFRFDFKANWRFDWIGLPISEPQSIDSCGRTANGFFSVNVNKVIKIIICLDPMYSCFVIIVKVCSCCIPCFILKRLFSCGIIKSKCKHVFQRATESYLILSFHLAQVLTHLDYASPFLSVLLELSNCPIIFNRFISCLYVLSHFNKLTRYLFALCAVLLLLLIFFVVMYICVYVRWFWLTFDELSFVRVL